MSEWKPIDTVPKDRRVLLICMKTKDDLYWRKGFMAVDMWSDEYQGFGAFNNLMWPPTHWMPLPDPPVLI